MMKAKTMIREYWKVTGVALVLSLFAVAIFATSSVAASKVVPDDKEWTITFNTVINPLTVKEETIYVTDYEGKKVETVELEIEKLFNTSGTINFTQWYSIVKVKNASDYEPGEYSLHVTKEVKNMVMKPIKDAATKNFTIEAKDYTEMSYEEVIEGWGELKFVTRDPNAEGGISRVNVMEEWYEMMQEEPELVFSPSEEKRRMIEQLRDSSVSMIYSQYPRREIISVNGKSYVDSVAYNPLFNTETDEFLLTTKRNMMPFNPRGNDQFLIDISTFSPSYVVYTKEQVEVVQSPGTPFIMDEVVYAPKKMLTTIDGLSLNGNSLTFNGIEVDVDVNREEGFTALPIIQVAESIGLDVRFNPEFSKIQIANFEIDKDPKAWPGGDWIN